MEIFLIFLLNIFRALMPQERKAHRGGLRVREV